MPLIALCDNCPDLVQVDGTDLEPMPPGWGWRIGPGGQTLLYCPTCRAAQDVAGRDFHRQLVALGWPLAGEWGRA
jgi:hypothetical protein